MAKLVLRWYRRCFIKSAFSRRAMLTPWSDDGGSFTGPSITPPSHWREDFQGDSREGMTDLVKKYIKSADEIPHHFQLHLMHGAEILGYKHPIPAIRQWWYMVYLMIVNDMHLSPESSEQMDYRLGDKEANWRECERGITASAPIRNS